MSSNVVPPLPLGTLSGSQSQRSQHHKPQQLGFANGVTVVRGASERTTGRRTGGSAKSEDIAAQPAWLVFDRQVLCFQAYFKEAVHEKRDENYRVRECKIFFFPEDDTIEVIEPRKPNSGLPQGKLIRRHRIPKPAPEDEETFIAEDLNIGEQVTLYGRTFMIVDCDKFTREFLEKLGMTVPEAIPMPADPYTREREKIKQAEMPLRPYERQDKLGQFLDNDRKVLRFYALWDDSETECGEKRYLIVHYFLADDSLEIREVQQPNSGRDGPGVFLRRQKLPKDHSGVVKPPGSVTSRTLLNVFAKSGLGGRSILDSLETGDGTNPHYTDADLEIGSELNVFGRRVLLCDCDDATKEYYRAKYGVEDFTPIEVEEEFDVEITPELPPYNGLGTEEDSLVSVKHLVLKAPKKEFHKWFKEGQNTMQFRAKLDAANSIDADRVFAVTFYLADDTVAVFEERQRNSGILGGKFLERRRVKMRDGYLSAHHFELGGTVTLNHFVFRLEDASTFAINYMIEHELPQSDINRIINVIAESAAPRQDDVTAALTDLDPEGTSAVAMEAFEARMTQLFPELTLHETRTLSHYLGQGDPKTVGVNVLELVSMLTK